MLEWHFPRLSFTLRWLYPGMAPSSSKFHHQVAHKWAAVLEWLILLSGGSPKVCHVGMAPSSSKFYPRVAHKRSSMLEWRLPPLNVTMTYICAKRIEASLSNVFAQLKKI